MSTNAPRNVAIATAGYQLAFWLAESEGCPPESGAECRVSWAEVLTRRGSAGSKRERGRDGGRERKSERKGERERRRKRGEREPQNDVGGEARRADGRKEREAKREGEAHRRTQHASPFNMADAHRTHTLPLAR